MLEVTGRMSSSECMLSMGVHQGWGQVQYLYLSTYLSVLDVLEYLVYGNV